ncbi:MAG: bifunctional oligoribonuclease/PAP phosphatase NrnA [Sphingobacteriia bacterium]|jgi:bifunctional oligoribonuclease and PAP phosphatase NrnA|nr:bifunctional oligoribonuclease/PAP phosphatase NrnA [Sphingobacteriia bacterium]
MLSKIISEKNIDEVRHLLNNAENVAIVTHISPDGDAVGSSVALAHFLISMKKKPIVIVPNCFPVFFNWLSGTQDIIVYEDHHEETKKAIADAQLIFCLDFNSIDRIDGIAPYVRQSEAKKILVDHHVNPAEFCDVVISHPSISSTSELIFRLICRLGCFPNITKECAEAIYMGMMTDTGNFSYNSMQPEIYQIISELLMKGIDKDAIYRCIYNTYSVNRMRLMGYCLNRKMKIYPEQKTAVIALTLEEQQRFDCQVGDTDGFVNLPLSIEGVDVSVLVREDIKKIKLSFRSQGTFPVNKMAAIFRGGGHVNAAGGESYQPMRKTLWKLENMIKNRRDFEQTTEEQI